MLFGDADFFRFEQIGMLWLLLLLPVLILVDIYFFRANFFNDKKEALRSFLLPRLKKGRFTTKWLIWSFAYLFLVIGLCNPQFGLKKEEVVQKGADVVFALDVSKSMLAEDIKPSRLERAKHSISKIVNGLGSDRVAIVVFAGDAYLQLPLTSDHSATKMYLNDVSVDMIPSQGTSIANALSKSKAAFGDKEGKGRAVILITDGENHDEEALDIAQQCAAAGIQIYPVGIGTPQGSTIPEYINGKKVGLLKDKNGSTVVSKINESFLIEVAEAGDGKYLRASNQNIGLENLFNEIRGMEKEEYEAKKFTIYEDRFSIFITISFLLFVLELLIFNNRFTLKNG